MLPLLWGNKKEQKKVVKSTIFNLDLNMEFHEGYVRICSLTLIEVRWRPEAISFGNE